MIIAQINPQKEQITLISIPRDIFYNGRKINSAYANYGWEEFKRELYETTGVKIDHYIIIDMMAFVEVVDALGGVDVKLENPVIDPSYKTFDYGKWGTLYYEAGTHHFSGTQALRIARSRHFSSDFARAKRQQSILEAAKNKAEKMIYKIPQIISLTLQKTITDLSAAEALLYYSRFRNYNIRMGTILSTQNVLISKSLEETESHDTCYKQLPGNKKTIEIQCAIPPPGQYILLPRKDWTDVKRYVQNALNR